MNEQNGEVAQQGFSPLSTHFGRSPSPRFPVAVQLSLGSGLHDTAAKFVGRAGRWLRYGLLALLSLDPSATNVAQDLVPLRYNHPGLVVDLGVGLWAWPIPCDADGDGDYDLMVSCPDKPSNGVWLFENQAGDTAQHPLPVFQPARKLSSTVHYVMPSYDQGQLRVLSPGREYLNFTQVGLAEPRELPLPANFHQPRGTQPKGPKVRHNQWRMVDYNGDGLLDLVVGIEDWSDYGWDDAWNAHGEWINGPLHGWVYIALNRGSHDAPSYGAPQLIELADGPLEVYGCPSPNFADWDGDGDLDLLCGEFLDKFTYFENVGTRTEPRYSVGQRVLAADGEQLAMDLQMIVPVAFDWDKDGDQDLIVGDEDGRVAWVENVSPAKSQRPVFERPRYFQQVADTLKCGALATPVGYDWDGDADTDLISGNTAGYIEIFENLSGAGVAEPRWAAPQKLLVGGRTLRIQAGSNGSIQGPAEAKWGYTTLSIADWNHDGLPDILLNSILGKVSWLRNVGTLAAPRFDELRPVEVEWAGAPPQLAWGWLRPQGAELLTQWRTTPVAVDWNRDGLTDLVMLDHEGYLAYFERQRGSADAGVEADDLRQRLQPPRRVFWNEQGEPWQLNSGTAGKSGRRKLCAADWDRDGAWDLLVNSANANWLRQVNATREGWVLADQGTLAQRNIEGHDVSPTVVDFDGDGRWDLVGGAEDGRLYWMAHPSR